MYFLILSKPRFGELLHQHSSRFVARSPQIADFHSRSAIGYRKAHMSSIGEDRAWLAPGLIVPAFSAENDPSWV